MNRKKSLLLLAFFTLDGKKVVEISRICCNIVVVTVYTIYKRYITTEVNSCLVLVVRICFFSFLKGSNLLVCKLFNLGRLHIALIPGNTKNKVVAKLVK